MVGQPYSAVHFKPFCIHLNYRHMYPYLRHNLRLYLTATAPIKRINLIYRASQYNRYPDQNSVVLSP